MPAAPTRHAVAEASAPTRVDLAGGTLDIWPLYLFHPGAATVNVAVDRRAFCRVETGGARVMVHSRDTLQKAEAASVSDLLGGGVLTLVAEILRALGVETGIRVTIQSRVPAGSGLGGSSALAVAVAAAVSRAVGRSTDPDSLWPVVRDAEARCIGVPTGVQDYHAAIHGGVLGLRLEAGHVGVERLSADPSRVEECLLLVHPGGTRFSGLNNWEVVKGQIDGVPEVREALAAIAAVAGRVRGALEQGRYDDVGPLLAEEWRARKRLAPGVTTPEIDRLVEVVAEQGGAAKVCGAGGGGMVAVWAPPGARGAGTRERVKTALGQAGFAPQPFRVDLRGLEVE